MTSGREHPSDYDWADDAAPDGSEDFALPDHSRARGESRAHALEGEPVGRSALEGPAVRRRTAGSDGRGALAGPTTPSDPEAPPSNARQIPEELGRDARIPEESGPYGAPVFSYDDVDEEGEVSDRRRNRVLPAWAILGIVAVQGAAAVAIVALVLGALQGVLGGGQQDPSAAPSGGQATRSTPADPTDRVKEPGAVTDSDGTAVTDGTGGYDDPATIGEHTVGWPVWTGGTLSVTPLSVDLDATVPGAGEADVVQDGYRLVIVRYEARYDGPAQLAPAEELWLTGESDRTYFPDVGEGMVPDPMRTVPPLRGGGTARFESAFLVPDAEIDTFRLGLETFNGDVVYFETP